ncbi:hypothetical protein MNBD_CHLOROFLEXI01-1601, partial [hydrothermal vent metagenome]
FQDGQIDLKAVAASNGLNLTDRFQIKFGFYDNFSFNPSSISGGDGYAIDDVALTCVPSGLTVTQLVDNPNPQPGEAMNFQIIVTNNASITATNAIINFIMASGLQLNGDVVVDGVTAVSGSAPPLVASGLTVVPQQAITIIVPAMLDDDIPPGTVLENKVFVTSDQFGSPPPFKQTVTVSSGSFQLFIPLVILSETKNP